MRARALMTIELNRTSLRRRDLFAAGLGSIPLALAVIVLFFLALVVGLVAIAIVIVTGGRQVRCRNGPGRRAAGLCRAILLPGRRRRRRRAPALVRRGTRPAISARSRGSAVGLDASLHRLAQRARGPRALGHEEHPPGEGHERRKRQTHGDRRPAASWELTIRHGHHPRGTGNSPEAGPTALSEPHTPQRRRTRCAVT